MANKRNSKSSNNNLVQAQPVQSAENIEKYKLKQIDSLGKVPLGTYENIRNSLVGIK